MRRCVFAVTAVAVALAALGLRACTGRAETADQSVTRATPEKSARDAGGPRTEQEGVPQDWSHDERGARAAAIAAVSSTGQIARAGFITRGDMIGIIASRRFAPTLARNSAAQLEDVLGDLASEGVTADAVLFRELPLTTRVVRADAQAARVEVWAVLVAGLPDHGAPRQLWRTVAVELIWEDGGWRIDGWTSAAGPTPALATNAPIGTADDLARVASWPLAGNG